MTIIAYIYKITKGIILYSKQPFYWLFAYLKFKINKVSFYKDFKSYGIPILQVSVKTKIFSIGHLFKMHNKGYNLIGRQQNCIFVTSPNAELIIGNNVGISSIAIVCQDKITIGDNVYIGGGTVIYDTDFHPLDYEKRISIKDNSAIKTKPIHIKQNAFIGAHCIILKGVTIGRNSIIGAGSVVTKDIPDNEIWAGNPTKFIRKI